MSTVTALDSLIESLVPQAKQDRRLKQELVIRCKDILDSRGVSSAPADIAYLSDLIKRQLSTSSPSGTSSLKFTNLLSRLLDQPVLTRKNASIAFLHALSSNSHSSDSPRISLRPLAPPTHQHQRASTRSASATSAQSAKSPPPRTAKLAKTQAERLREYRVRNGRQRLSENLLLRDTLYLLQGISGKYVRFASPSGSREPDLAMNRLVFSEDSKNLIPAPTKALIHRLSEVGHLYKRVENFVRDREGRTGSVGMIEQSLCHHLQEQLTEYYRLIAVLETQMAFSTPDSPVGENILDGDQTDALDSGEQENGTVLTLRRLDVWITEWRLRMRMMSVCVESARDTYGGALVNLIHGYTDNGDPFVRQFTDQLLEEVSKPFFSTLHRWLFSGELYDPFSEFFVAIDPELAHVQYVHPSAHLGAIGADAGILFGGDGEAPDVSGDREGGQRLWETKYGFRKDMLPMFVGEAFGRKIFSTGKSLNFIRYSCHDSDWVVTREKMSNTGGTLKYSDIAGLERSIDTAYQTASRRLFDVFIDKFHLLTHLSALKNYLLLNYGDFANQLLEALGPSLSRQANTLYRHHLTATLETAIRSSNATYDPPDVLRRLDARMLEYSQGEIGWDVFTLEYRIDPPLDTVLDADSMVKYLKLFNHLWKMKRVENALNNSWMRISAGARTFIKLPELEHEWHRIRIAAAEMMHLVQQMQAYSHLEVIECSWKVLIDFFNKKEGDLDAMIDAHRTYLDRMVKKMLFLSLKAGREENLLNQVRDLFVTILQFRDATDNFYNYCLTESSRRDRMNDNRRGLYTGPTTDSESRQDLETLSRVLGLVSEYSSLFSEKALGIVHALQSHPDLDCRFLGIRLSFSDFYKSRKELAQQKN